MKNYIVDENNRKKSVIIPIKEYESLLEELRKSKKTNEKLEKVKNKSIEGSDFKKAFGALESDKSADEIIEEIRNSRNINRNIEKI